MDFSHIDFLVIVKIEQYFKTIDKNELNKIIVQLRKLVILLGNWKSHTSVWGSKQTYRTGGPLEETINSNSLYLFNAGSETYLNPTYGNLSAIDLTSYDPLIYTDKDFRVYQSLAVAAIYQMCWRTLNPARKIPHFGS